MADATSDALSPAVDDAVKRLLLLLGDAHAELLAELLETILDDTGYGGVEIVVADGRIQTMKLTKSYRAQPAAASRGKPDDR